MMLSIRQTRSRDAIVRGGKTVAYVAIGNEEVGEQIVAYVNAHDDLVRALSHADNVITQLCKMVCNISNDPKKVRTEDFTEKVRAALKLVEQL